MRELVVTSLFSGCGGKDIGFISAGFKVAWANDIDRAACESYASNIGRHIVCKDIREVPSAEIPSTDVVIGGFPCQGFSIVGARRLNDERNFLYKEMKRVVEDKRPAFFVAENVRGLLSLAGGNVVKAIVDEFRGLGYRVDYKLLNAQDYGTPQHRQRVFIIGNRLGLPNPFPSPRLPLRTLRDAIGDIETLGGLPNHQIITDWLKKSPHFIQIMQHLGEGQKLCNVRLGPRSVYTWDIPEVFGKTSKKEKSLLLTIAGNRRRKVYGKRDGNPLPMTAIEQLCDFKKEEVERLVASLLKKDYLVGKGGGFELKNSFNGIFRRPRWDLPCEAILTVFANPRNYIHPSQDRPFSVRECARIQDFPDDFQFSGTLKEQYTQIGNAVPARMAEAVASGVMFALRGST